MEHMFDLQKKGRVVMQRFKVDELIPHPKNDFFFDDMEGQKWQEFLESVRTSGVIEPPVVTDKRVIVSGHQRIRACKELDIETINCEVRIYENEDKVLKDLIETNIRQRGTIAGSELKMGRIIKELERIYGIKKGRPEKIPQLAAFKSQEELAQDLGMSLDKLQRIKKLTDLPDEYQEMLESGRISANTAASLISKLTDEEQQELLRALPATEKITQAVAQQYIAQIKGLTETNATLAQEAVEATRAVKASTDSEEYLRMKKAKEDALQEARDNYEKWQAEKKKNDEKPPKKNEIKEAADKAREETKQQYRKMIERLEKEVEEAKQREAPEPETIEVVPDDYEELKRAKAELDAIKNSSDPDISKQILRIHTDDRTPEQKLNNYEKRAIDEVGGFLSILRGLEVQFDLCNKLPVTTKRLLRTNITEIQQILAKMDNAIMEGNEECKTA
jgi:ParB-like chromosome segregation protein Spo0J